MNVISHDIYFYNLRHLSEKLGWHNININTSDMLIR